MTRDERGSALALVVGVMTIALTAVLMVSVVVRVAAARIQASTAADLAALAGAHQGSCAPAAGVVHANAARLRSCIEQGADVLVHAEVDLYLAGRQVVVGAQARAGPPADPGTP